MHAVSLFRLCFVLTVSLATASLALAQEWPHYGNDPGGAKYSPLEQIDKTNVTTLKVAWTYHTGDISDGTKYPSRSAFETTPLVIDGVLYLTTPFARAIALDAETGKELWAFDPKLDRDRRYNLFANRGVNYWKSGEDQRIFLGTDDGRLFALDTRTGKPVPSFGNNGWIDLRTGSGEEFPEATYGLTSPVAIYRDLVITGSHVPKGTAQGPSGGIRAFDAYTGKLVWRFHTIPRTGEFGNDTWEGDSWKNRGGVNAWSILSVDHERGMVFAPLAQPATGTYGGDRKGHNLFGSSLVALDAATGKRIWHFQTVHHDIWDWDVPAQPNLVTVRRDGKDIPAVAQVTKTGFVFVLDRLTGEPLFPVEERPVPQSVVPGEQTSPTQPFPVKPPPFARQTFSFDELTGVTPESRAECEKLLEGAVTGPMFRPAWTGRSFSPARMAAPIGAVHLMMPPLVCCSSTRRTTVHNGGFLEKPRWRECLVDPERRPRTRHGLRPSHFGGHGHLRRRPQRR